MRFQKLLVLLLGFSVVTAIAPVRIAIASPAIECAQTPRSSSAKISEAEIKAMLNALQMAGKNQNIGDILNYYAPFVSSKLTIKSGSSSETIELDGLQEHSAFLENAYKGIKAIEILSESADVDILASDEMAIIRRERTVAITATNGKRYLLDATSIAKVAPVDGRLKVINVEETAHIGQMTN
jgi:hypothetical protein